MKLRKTVTLFICLFFAVEFFAPFCCAIESVDKTEEPVLEVEKMQINSDIESVENGEQFLEAVKNNDEQKKLNKQIKIKSKTKVPVIVTHVVTSKNVHTGQKIEAQICRNIVINNVTVFKDGDRAVLNVMYSKKAGILGVPGKMTIRDGEVFDINGKEYKVDLEQILTGKSKLYPKILSTISLFFLWPLLFFALVRGGEAEVPTGTPIETLIRNNAVFVPVL